jgi:6-phosphogluconolactonase (cycloisomerase 2 family)
MAHNVTETAAALELRPDGRLGDLVRQPDMPKLGYLVHQIRMDPTNRWAFVPVRGNDAQIVTNEGGTTTTPEQVGRLYVFSFEDGVLTGGQVIELATGVGPRHLDFHPTQSLVYVAMERGNELVTYEHDAGTLTERFRTTTLGDPSFKFPDQRAGAIHVHPSGRWLYVTNRNVAPCRSSVPCPDRETKPFAGGENNIAVFSIDAGTGRPTLVENADSHGFEPRTFTFDPGGNFLIAGNMMNIVRREGERLGDVAPNLAVFRIGSDGELTFVRSYDQPDSGPVWWVGAY